METVLHKAGLSRTAPSDPVDHPSVPKDNEKYVIGKGVFVYDHIVFEKALPRTLNLKFGHSIFGQALEHFNSTQVPIVTFTHHLHSILAKLIMDHRVAANRFQEQNDASATTVENLASFAFVYI